MRFFLARYPDLISITKLEIFKSVIVRRVGEFLARARNGRILSATIR